MKKADFFRRKYPKFVYQNYEWRLSNKNLEIFFDFVIEPDISFRPKIIIRNIEKEKIKQMGKGTMDNLVFHLGLIEILSYWKATVSPVIEIRAGELNKKQIRWWKELIFRGMAQFFYENKIDWRKLDFIKIKISFSKYRKFKKESDTDLITKLDKDRVLMAVGGGKDSVVSLELLKKIKKEIRCFSLNPTESSRKITNIAGCKDPIFIERKIDDRLLGLNNKGFLNGHTPFSAYLAFLSVLLTGILGCKFVVFSNERSSEEGNVRYLGRIVNHQYSKSFDFENKFRQYCREYLIKGVEWFSFLRPLYDIQVAKLFSPYPQYFLHFMSCNEAHKTSSGVHQPTAKWCCSCPKCLFVFMTLYPFLSDIAHSTGKEGEMVKIFGKNLFNDRNLIPLMLRLIGEEKFKPFECVGTRKESRIALYLSWLKFEQSFNLCKNHGLPVLLKYFQEKILSRHHNLQRESGRILNGWGQHNLPKEFERVLKKTLKSNNVRRI